MTLIINQKTYEAGKLIAYVQQLEKENAELSCSVGDFGELQDRLKEEQRKNNGLEEQLTTAKEIIRKYLGWADWKGSNCPSFADICKQAEAFLNSEVEK